MPKVLDDGLLEEKDKLEHEKNFYLFLDVQFGNKEHGESGWENDWKFLTNHPPVSPGDTTVTFDGRTYQRLPLAVGAIEETTEGTLPELQIQVANTADIMGSVVELYDLSGKVIYVYLVYYRENPSAALSDIFFIDAVSSTRMVVTFTLSILEPFQIDLPLKCFTRNKFPSIPFRRRGGFIL